MEETSKTVNGWDEYITNFLKITNVKDENDAFLCSKVEEIPRDDEKQIRLTLQKGELIYSYDLNKTNAVFCKVEGKDITP